MKTILSAITASLALWLPLRNALAADTGAETVDVRDGASVPITLSARELTHISGASGTVLSRLIGVDGVLDVHAGTDENNKPTGDVFVKPVDPVPGKTFSFFIRDAGGATYTLLATERDVPAQAIVLRAVSDGSRPRPMSAAGAARDREVPFVRRVATLMRVMAMGESDERSQSGERGERSENRPNDAWQTETVDRTVPMWAEVETRLVQRLSDGGSLRGEVWRVRNTSHADVHLDESQFKGLYPDIRAVAIATLSLPPSATTEVYIVRGAAP